MMTEDKERYQVINMVYVMLRVLNEGHTTTLHNASNTGDIWIVDVRDNETDEYVNSYECGNYDEALTEYTAQVVLAEQQTKENA